MNIWGDDVFFFDEQGILDYCDENDITDSTTLKLMISEPNHWERVDFYEMNQDTWPEELAHLPKALFDAQNAINEIIKAQPPISWTEGRYRTTVDLNEDLPNTTNK